MRRYFIDSRHMDSIQRVFFRNAVMHKAQVRLEDGESSIEIEIEIGIEIDSVQFYASV
jgi:hypothetical protein